MRSNPPERVSVFHAGVQVSAGPSGNIPRAEADKLVSSGQAKWMYSKTAVRLLRSWRDNGDSHFPDLEYLSGRSCKPSGKITIAAVVYGSRAARNAVQAWAAPMLKVREERA